MTAERDRLLSAYLTSEIDPGEFSTVDELLKRDPEAAARLLELAVVDLLLLDASRERREPGSEPQPYSASPDLSDVSESSAATEPGKVIAFPRKTVPTAQRWAGVPKRKLGPWLAAAAGVALGVSFVGERLFSKAKSIATIEATTGDVRIVDQSGAPTAAKGRALNSGARLETAAGGECRLRFAGEATGIRIASGSRLTLEINRRGGKVLRLEAGRIDAEVAPQRREPMLVQTARAVATVVGTRFALAASETRTAIQVTSGAVRFSDAKTAQVVRVANNRMAVAGVDVPMQLVSEDVVASVDELATKANVLQGRRLLYDWAFEGDTVDEAGSLTRTELGVAYGPGHRGKALDVATRAGGFTTGLVSLPEQFELDLWVYLPPAPFGPEKEISKRAIICNSPSGFSEDGFRLFAFANPSDVGSLWLETGNGETGLAAKSLAGGLLTDRWNHVVVRCDRVAGRVRFIINGADQTGPRDKLHLPFGYIAPLTIGMAEHGNYPLLGLLDDLRIYALSPAPPPPSP